MPIDPNATYAPTPRGLHLQLYDLIDELAERLGEGADRYEANQRARDGEFDDLVGWLALQDPAGYLRRVYGDVFADWWEGSNAPGPLTWPVHEMMYNLAPEVAQGARAVVADFSGFQQWARRDADVNHVLALEAVMRASVTPVHEDPEEGLVGGYEQECWLHDGARWVCTGRALDLSRVSPEVISAFEASLARADFGEVRSLLQRPPSSSLWSRLAMLILSVCERDDFDGTIAPYIMDHIEDWPNALRRGSGDTPELMPFLEKVMVSDPSELGAARPAEVELPSGDALLALLTHPVTETLEVLIAHGERLSVEVARALAGAELPSLGALHVYYEEWERGACEVLREAPWLRGLTELHLTGRGLGPAWPTLFEGEGLERVTWPQEPGDVSGLLEGLGRLRELAVTGAQGEQVVEAILASAEPLGLEGLWLLGGQVGEHASARVARTDRLPELVTLGLSGPRGLARTPRALARSASLPKLEYLIVFP